MIGFGQAKAAQELACGHPRQKALALFLGAVGVDRRHRQGTLHADRRTKTGIHPLEFTHDQAVGDIADPGAAVALDGGPEKAQFRQFLHDRKVEGLVAIGRNDSGHQLFLRVLARCVADHPFLVAEQILDE